MYRAPAILQNLLNAFIQKGLFAGLAGGTNRIVGNSRVGNIRPILADYPLEDPDSQVHPHLRVLRALRGART
jgi:hypothetical protein